MPPRPEAPPETDHAYELPANWDVVRWVPENAKRILDLECGNGENARALRRTGRIIDGITASPTQAEMARHHCRDVHVNSLEHGLPEAGEPRYDVIIAAHVLQHVCFPEKLLADTADRLDDHGLFIVAVPNLLNWRYRLKLLFGKFEYGKGGAMDRTHFKWYTYDTCRQLLQQNGYKVLRAYAHGPLPLSFLRKVIPAALAWRLDRVASFLLPGLIGYELIYVATPKKRLPAA